MSYSKSVRLHALHTNYETRPAIAVHCYLICPRRRAALPRSRFTFHVPRRCPCPVANWKCKLYFMRSMQAQDMQGGRQVGLADTLIAI